MITPRVCRLFLMNANFIQQSLDAWCKTLAIPGLQRDMLTLSRTLCISKNELSLFFDQCQHSNFRIWLSEIGFRAAKKMMREYPDYSNDIISAECGFPAAPIFTAFSRLRLDVRLQNGENLSKRSSIPRNATPF